MSDRSRRVKAELDYKILHKTGEKVYKNDKSGNMDSIEKRKLGELQISEEIVEFFKIYDLNELDTIEDITESIEQINVLGKAYRHIHVELKSVMGENDHNGNYQNFQKISEQIRTFRKESKNKIKTLRKEVKENEEEKMNLEKLSEEEDRKKMKDEVENKMKASLRIEEQVFREKLESEFKSLELKESNEIKESCNKFENLLEEYYKLLSRVKIGFNDDYKIEFEKIFDSTIIRIRDQIKTGKLKIRELNTEVEKNLAAEKTHNEKQAQDNFVKEQKFQANILSREIEMRCVALCEKCDSSELKNMSDYQILECHKNMNAIDREMHDIFGKVTAFSKLAALCGVEKDEMVIKPDNLQEKALKMRNAYAMKLHSIFTERDISEEKLKNASGLNIDLSKFKGYESKLDIYSFKTEFENLIQPTFQKRYWVDTLKKKYLAGSALTLVEKTEIIDEIWTKLINAYGNVKLLLQNKISSLDKLENLEKVKGDEKVGIALAKIINMMTELSTLAEKHSLENKLYIGGGLERVLSLIGEDRERKFLGKNINEKSDTGSSGVLAEKLEWENLKEFLKRELALREKLTLMQKSKSCLGINPATKAVKDKKEKNTFVSEVTASAVKTEQNCHICGQNDHVLSTDTSGNKLVDYFSCKTFVKMSPKERRVELQKKNLCLQCLIPGMRYDEKHTCYKKYVCPDSYHTKYPKGLHVLVCQAHRKKQANIDLLEDYKKNIISKRSNNFDTFTKNISLMCYNENELAPSTFGEGNNNVLPDVFESAIFMLQTVNVGGKKFNLFYDTGCGDVVVKKSAVDDLVSMGRAKREVPGPITMSGVGDHKSVCEHGIYSICLPLKNGRDAVFSGVCLDRVTTVFPKYALKEVEKDVRKLCKKQGGQALLNTIPRLSTEVGGETDILIGIKYLRYHPQKVWESPTGLSVSESCFLSVDGTTGVIGGPHVVFTDIERRHQSAETRKANYGSQCYYTSPVGQYRSAFRFSKDMPLLGDKPVENYGDQICGTKQKILLEVGTCNEGICVAIKTPKCVKTFDEIETAGTEITYRCIDCRNCQKCKKSQKLEAISIQEEIEQDLINRSVKVDITKGMTIAKLPFVTNPDPRLVPNEKIALKIYEGQIKALSNKPEDKRAVIMSEGKLQELGFVDFVDNLPKEDKEFILSNVRYFIPWRAVWNPNSLSTPCRLVLDGSFCPRGGCSLNSLLAKGANNMNNLIMILIRWTMHKCAFHTDISKMYNAIHLDKTHWRYQLYLWEKDLSLSTAPRWKVIKTVIYGVRPSGNLAECGLRKTAELAKSQCPRAYDVIMNDIYVDDCLSGDNSINKTFQTTDQLSIALAKGGFSLKGFTFSGKDPPENLSNDDGKSVVVGGVKWFPKEDLISLNISNLNFSKKNRGRKPQNMIGKIPEKITKRDCVSKVAEVWDPLGRVVALTSGFKIDINQLTLRKLDWDDEIPEDLRQIWLSNFEMIQEIKHIRFKRAIVPEDAVDIKIETIDTADASQVMICVAIYVRFRRKSGGYSCQLVFARSKVVPKDMSMPRAELLAASLNASTGHVVKTAFGDRHKKCWKLTDSQVALHWIGCIRSKLKMWVRNRVIEIQRLAGVNDWRYVDSKNMIADLGTRKGVTVADVNSDSAWINGLNWMAGEESDFPVKTAADIVLDSECKREARKETIVIDVIDGESEDLVYMPSRYVPDMVGDRYKFSRYLIDPNRFRFRKVVRVLGLVFLFIKNLFAKINKPQPKVTMCDLTEVPDVLKYQWDKYLVTVGKKTGNTLDCRGGLIVDLSKTMLNAALQYYFIKATKEIKKFLPESKYKNISETKNDVLYHTGRILPTQEIVGQLMLCDTSFDLSKATFCVPMVDSLSPIAYAIANEIHWYHPDVKHGGIESVLRQVQCVAYVIGGRNLIKSIKKACLKCKLLEKREVKVTMGPKHNSNLCIAPAFHNTQVDICGPFDSYSNANKRAKIKIWLVIFCCSTTGAVDCKVMEDYSTDSFVLAFIRFSCRYGYPCNLFPDYGSQLIKGCKDMIISFSDIKHKLSIEFGVEFQMCPVGAHYVHGKVERKIKQIKKSFEKTLNNNRLSIIQWETLGQQVVNSINNLPIGLGNKTECLENLDLLTPNRLLLGRNNNRCPSTPLVLSRDVKKIIATNSNIHKTWFKSWLISYVPTLVTKPKWFENDRDVSEGDIVLFSKSEKEFEDKYQYGIVKSTCIGRDGYIRTVTIEYNNHNEDAKRTTIRGVRDLVIIHPVDELGINKELYDLADNEEQNIALCNCSVQY